MTTTVRSNADGSSTVLVGATPAIEIASNGKVQFPRSPNTNVGPAFRVNAAGSQSIAENTFVKVTILDTEVFDTANCFANDRFTPNVPGYYLVTGKLDGLASAAITSVAAAIYKNGASVVAVSMTSDDNQQQAMVTELLYMNGTTDYVELWGRVVGGTSAQNIYNAFMHGFLARAA